MSLREAEKAAEQAADVWLKENREYFRKLSFKNVGRCIIQKGAFIPGYIAGHNACISSLQLENEALKEKLRWEELRCKGLDVPIALKWENEALRKALGEAVEILESAKNGLQWFINEYNAANPAFDEELQQMELVITKSAKYLATNTNEDGK